MTMHDIIILQYHKRQNISSRDERAKDKKKRLDYIPILPEWMKLNYSSSINE